MHTSFNYLTEKLSKWRVYYTKDKQGRISVEDKITNEIMAFFRLPPQLCISTLQNMTEFNEYLKQVHKATTLIKGLYDKRSNYVKAKVRDGRQIKLKWEEDVRDRWEGFCNKICEGLLVIMHKSGYLNNQGSLDSLNVLCSICKALKLTSEFSDHLKEKISELPSGNQIESILQKSIEHHAILRDQIKKEPQEPSIPREDQATPLENRLAFLLYLASEKMNEVVLDAPTSSCIEKEVSLLQIHEIESQAKYLKSRGVRDIRSEEQISDHNESSVNFRSLRKSFLLLQAKGLKNEMVSGAEAFKTIEKSIPHLTKDELANLDLQLEKQERDLNEMTTELVTRNLNSIQRALEYMVTLLQ